MRTVRTIFTWLGIILVALALWQLAAGAWFRARAERVTGEVTEVVLAAGAEGNAYCPVFGYTAPDGGRRVYQSELCAFPADFAVGDKTTLYVTGERVELASFSAVWLWPLLLGALGATLWMIGKWVLPQDWP